MNILGNNKIVSYLYISDINGKPSILARVLQNRDIYNQGKSSVHTFLGIILVAGLVSALITAVMLEIMVLSRIDFLDVSRLEQGKMSFLCEPSQMEIVLESVAYQMKTVLAEMKLYSKLDSHTLDSLTMVWADKNRLEQVVYNLVGNAAKFIDAGGITISTKHDAKHGLVKVLMTDTGRDRARAIYPK